MEMGSGSGGLPASSDSLNGLKFGQKIYFEDAQGITSTGGSSSLPVAAMAAPSHAPPPPPPAAHKKEKGQQQQQQPPPHPPPRCQVEGCNVDLTGAKSYYCRHKVCAMHSKFPKVVVAGIEQRFCQQCSRFHRLHEFDQGKRSCRRRLAGHNERRRKPPPGPLSPRFGRLSSSSCEEGSRFRSFLMDFSYPRTQFPSRELWPTVRSIDHAASGGQWQGGSDAPRGAVATHPYIQPASHYCSELPPSECLAGVSDSSCALSLLSSQPWGTTVAPRGRAPNIPASSGLNGPLMGQQMVVTSTCAAHPWGFKNHGAGSSNQEILQGVGLGHYDDDDDGNGRFSRELELALEGNGHCPDHGPVRAYDHSGHGMHWSL